MKRSYKWTFGALALSFALGCGVAPGGSESTVVAQQAAATAAQPATARPDYTGEELFLGIAFGSGRVADALPEIGSAQKLEHAVPDAQQLAKAKTQLMGLVRQMRAQQPAFFADFKADMESGDRLRIERSLDAAGKLAQASARKLQKRAAQAHKGAGVHADDYCATCVEDGGGGGDDGAGDEGGADSGDSGGADSGDSGGADSGDTGGTPPAPPAPIVVDPIIVQPIFVAVVIPVYPPIFYLHIATSSRAVNGAAGVSHDQFVDAIAVHLAK